MWLNSKYCSFFDIDWRGLQSLTTGLWTASEHARYNSGICFCLPNISDQDKYLFLRVLNYMFLTHYHALTSLQRNISTQNPKDPYFGGEWGSRYIHDTIHIFLWMDWSCSPAPLCSTIWQVTFPAKIIQNPNMSTSARRHKRHPP